MKKLILVLIVSIFIYGPSVVHAEGYSTAWRQKMEQHKPSSGNPDFAGICGMWNNSTSVNKFSINYEFKKDGRYKLTIKSLEAGQILFTEAGIWSIVGKGIVTQKSVIVKDGQAMLTNPDDKQFIDTISYALTSKGGLALTLGGEKVDFKRIDGGSQ